MRKITQEATQALLRGARYSNSNTLVSGGSMYLHGNEIAKLKDGKLSITLAGWNTNTTRERLNGLPWVRVNTKQGQAFLNGREWGGEWVEVGSLTPQSL